MGSLSSGSISAVAIHDSASTNPTSRSSLPLSSSTDIRLIRVAALFPNAEMSLLLWPHSLLLRDQSSIVNVCVFFTNNGVFFFLTRAWFLKHLQLKKNMRKPDKQGQKILLTLFFRPTEDVSRSPSRITPTIGIYTGENIKSSVIVRLFDYRSVHLK